MGTAAIIAFTIGHNCLQRWGGLAYVPPFINKTLILAVTEALRQIACYLPLIILIMDSIKTKTNNYSLVNGKAVAGVVLVPKAGHFIGYVAWEWENEAKKKNFAIIESAHLIGHFNSDWIDDIADYGNDVTHKKDIQKLFPHLF